MIIEIKFGLGDTVYYISSGQIFDGLVEVGRRFRVRKFEIDSVTQLSRNNCKTFENVYYEHDVYDAPSSRWENELYATEKEAQEECDKRNVKGEDCEL